MTLDISEMSIVRARLASLEAQNQRLKWAGIAALATIASVILMGQAAPSPHVIEAQRFVLKDADGRVRGWLGVIGKGSELNLGNAYAQPMMGFMVSTDSSDLHFYGSDKSGMTLGVNSGHPALSMAGAEGIGGAEISVGTGGPNLSLSDRSGFSTVIGSTQLPAAPSGMQRQTPAASVVLMDRDKKVIWHAP